jgi:putative FmdB family regulatory protein
MPLLDLQCQKCSAVFEELVMGDRLPSCPECGAGEVRRLYSQISPPGRIGLRGAAAKRSDSRRAEREVARRQGWAEKRERKQKG